MSLRPSAAAAAFWRFASSWNLSCELVRAGAAETIAASPAATTPSDLTIEGILNVCACVGSEPFFNSQVFLILFLSFSVATEYRRRVYKRKRKDQPGC